MIIDNLLKWDEGNESILPLQVDFSHFIHYIACPRFWFYRYVLALQPQDWLPSVDLVCGSSWHAGMEAGYLAMKENPYIDPQQLVDISLEAAEAKWHEASQGQLQLDEGWPKSFEAVARNLHQYWWHYATVHADQEILAVEHPFSIPVLPELPLLYGTIDLISRDVYRERMIVTEHKTAKSLAQKWQSLWENSFQLEAYPVAVRMHYHELPEVCVSGSLFNKTCGAKFLRLWYNYPEDRLVRFWYELIYRMQQLHQDTRRLIEEVRSGNNVQAAFPRQQSACHQFRTCQFYTLCTHDINPRKWASNPPAGWTYNYEKSIYNRKEVDDAAQG